MEIPDGALPVSSVAITRGGEALRSITDSRLSGACFVGSAGSTFIAAVTRARLSSGVRATLTGGPTTLTGAWISPTTRGEPALRSMIATVSGGGLETTLTAPLTRTALLSLAETAICASATETSVKTARSRVRATHRWAFIVTSCGRLVGGG